MADHPSARRRFQFSLRELLLATGLVGAIIGCIIEHQRAERILREAPVFSDAISRAVRNLVSNNRDDVEYSVGIDGRILSCRLKRISEPIKAPQHSTQYAQGYGTPAPSQSPTTSP
jgi:hypothetical protein